MSNKLNQYSKVGPQMGFAAHALVDPHTVHYLCPAKPVHRTLPGNLRPILMG